MNSFALRSLTLSLIASFTTVSIALAKPVNAQTRTFLQPRLSPPGQPSARLDRCTNSFRYPEHCSNASGREVANRFCSDVGFSRALQYSITDRSWKQRERLWKYIENWNNGKPQRFWGLGEGGFMIEAIECSK